MAQAHARGRAQAGLGRNPDEPVATRYLTKKTLLRGQGNIFLPKANSKACDRDYVLGVHNQTLVTRTKAAIELMYAQMLAPQKIRNPNTSVRLVTEKLKRYCRKILHQNLGIDAGSPADEEWTFKMAASLDENNFTESYMNPRVAQPIEVAGNATRVHFNKRLRARNWLMNGLVAPTNEFLGKRNAYCETKDQLADCRLEIIDLTTRIGRANARAVTLQNRLGLHRDAFIEECTQRKVHQALPLAQRAAFDFHGEQGIEQTRKVRHL